MEKHTNTKRTKQYLGLLIFFAISINSIFAASWSSLRIKPDKEYCFSGETCQFTLEIPGVLPSRVDTTVQSTPENVTIESSSKEEYVKNGIRGTLIKLNFRFSKAGTYQIPSLATRIDWWSYSIKFLPITVYDNPILMQPILSSNLQKNLEVGQPTTFTIYGKFFNELININYELDTKIILTKNKDLTPLPYHIGAFSTETYPLAEFTIIPLEEGNFKLPPIYGIFRNYAGNTVSIPLGEISLKSKRENAPTSETVDDSQFQKVFSTNFPEAYEEISVTPVLSPIDESELLLTNLKNQVKQKNILIIISTLSLVFLFISFILFVVFAIIKKKTAMITFMCVFAFFLISTIYFSVVTSKKEAISLSCSVKTVPEEKSNTVMQLSTGDKIRILESISNWYSIESEDNRKGWILQSQCILINQEELEKLEKAGN